MSVLLSSSFFAFAVPFVFLVCGRGFDAKSVCWLRRRAAASMPRPLLRTLLLHVPHAMSSGNSGGDGLFTFRGRKRSRDCIIFPDEIEAHCDFCGKLTTQKHHLVTKPTGNFLLSTVDQEKVSRGFRGPRRLIADRFWHYFQIFALVFRVSVLSLRSSLALFGVLARKEYWRGLLKRWGARFASGCDQQRR